MADSQDILSIFIPFGDQEVLQQDPSDWTLNCDDILSSQTSIFLSSQAEISSSQLTERSAAESLDLGLDDEIMSELLGECDETFQKLITPSHVDHQTFFPFEDLPVTPITSEPEVKYTLPTTIEQLIQDEVAMVSTIDNQWNNMFPEGVTYGTENGEDEVAVASTINIKRNMFSEGKGLASVFPEGVYGAENSDDSNLSCLENSNVSSSTSGNDLSRLITDEDLVGLSVKDMNDRLRRLPKDEADQLKKRRRQLKNRCYAQTCRSRRTTGNEAQRLEIENLKREKANLESNLALVKRERNEYKERAAMLEKQLWAVGQLANSTR